MHFKSEVGTEDTCVILERVLRQVDMTVYNHVCKTVTAVLRKSLGYKQMCVCLVPCSIL